MMMMVAACAIKRCYNAPCADDYLATFDVITRPLSVLPALLGRLLPGARCAANFSHSALMYVYSNGPVDPAFDNGSGVGWAGDWKTVNFVNDTFSE